MRLVQGHGVNDMSWGWASENEWNKMVYRKWQKMLYRCYDEDFHKTEKGKCYIGCTVCDRWLMLSNFVEDFTKLDGYDRELFLNGELVLDKDIKSRKRGEKNKVYIMIECLLTTQSENSKEANRTRDNSYLQGENNPMYGKHQSEATKQKISEANKCKQRSEETKRKISEAQKGRHHTEETKRKMSENNAKNMQGKFGSEHPNAKKVAQYDKQTLELIKVWDSMMDVERELGIANSNISACCKGKRKTAGGFIWRYIEGE